jgi:GTPase
VLVYFRVRSGKTSLEGRVEETKLGPVCVQVTDHVRVQASIKVGTLQGGEDGAQTGLGCHTGHAVDGGINSVRTSLSASNHGCNTGSSRVVSMYVDGQVGVLLADGADQETGSTGLEYTSH